jgi:hypothetical protein
MDALDITAKSRQIFRKGTSPKVGMNHNLAALTHNLAQKTAQRRQKACKMFPLPFEAILCVTIHFGQRYGSQLCD